MLCWRFHPLGGVICDGDGNQTGQVYEYNDKEKKLSEIEDRRFPHRENGPSKLHRIDNHLFYTGGKRTVMRIIFDYGDIGSDSLRSDHHQFRD